MDTITIPPPETLQQRISDCETELRSLRRLLRMAKSMQSADEARRRRENPKQYKREVRQ
jgi:hypothetical protein